MKISNVASIVNIKIDASILTAHTYISTECMLPNCGGIENCSSIPNGKVTSFDKNDILLSNIRPYFKKLWFSTRSGGCSNDVICLRITSRECLPKYLYYALCTDEFIDSFSASSKGTKMPRGDKNALLTYEIPDRNIEDQLHIVDILGSIDAKIENNEQLIDIFENLAAKKYLDFANKTSTKIKLEDVIELFDSKRIPLSSREREQRKGIYPYYGATGILDYVNGFLFSGEYVLFAEDGTVTDTNGHPIVQLVNGSFWVNNHAHILKGKNGWNDYTLYVALKQINVDKAVTGAVQPKINQANLLSLEIPNLSNNNLQTINTELDVVFHKVFHLRSENKKLQELKGLYLKKFFE